MSPVHSSSSPRTITLDDETNKDSIKVSQIDLEREYARRYIAYAIVGLLSFIVVAAFASYWLEKDSANKDNIEELIKFTSALIAPVIGIVGAVTGFYFGAAATAQTRDGY